MCPWHFKIDFIAKCLSTFVTHCTLNLIESTDFKVHVPVFYMYTMNNQNNNYDAIIK